MARKTLPGFELDIEIVAPEQPRKTVVKDVILIYAVLPDTLSYIDEDDGKTYDRYIEPLKPIIINSKNDAIHTLSETNIDLTREIRNIIKLVPNDSTVAICKIVKRNGESPKTNNLQEMYEALDYAFEATENYPIKQVVLADISLDKSVDSKPFAKTVSYDDLSSHVFDKVSVLKLIGEITRKNGLTEVAKNVSYNLGIQVKRDSNSESQPDGIGIYSDVTFMVNDIPAVCIKEDGTEAEMAFKINTTYEPSASDESQKVVVDGLTSPTGNSANKIAVIDKELHLTLGEEFKIKLDEDNVVNLKQGTIIINGLGQSKEAEKPEVATVLVGKNSANCHILLRTLKHVHKITKTKNNCMLIMSPEPPKNQSTIAKQEYISRCERLSAEVMNITNVPTSAGMFDLGMYLTIPIGVNRIQNIGGIYGFPSSILKGYEGNDVTTNKLTMMFEVGDIVEIWTYDRNNVISMQTKVLAIKNNPNNTTTITLEKEVPSSFFVNERMPKYIVNVNNKDFNGNYMAMQWANVINQAGVDQAADSLTWDGECQLAFSEKELDLLNSLNFAVLDQLVGTDQGKVSRSQLMSGPKTQFSDVETLMVLYTLVSGIKKIAQPELGKRHTSVALLKTKIEETVFEPAKNRFIKEGYDLRLKLIHLPERKGKKLKTLEVAFEVTEIKTLKLLRIRAQVNQE